MFSCLQEVLEDTKGVIRIHKSKKDRQHNGQKDKEVLEDTKGVIRIHKSKVYAVRRHLAGLCLRLRRMNQTVEDAFLHMLFMWLVHFKSFDVERPKYGLLSTSLSIVLLSL